MSQDSKGESPWAHRNPKAGMDVPFSEKAEFYKGLQERLDQLVAGGTDDFLRSQHVASLRIEPSNMGVSLTPKLISDNDRLPAEGVAKEAAVAGYLVALSTRHPGRPATIEEPVHASAYFKTDSDLAMTVGALEALQSRGQGR